VCGKRLIGRIFGTKEEKTTGWYNCTTRSFILIGLLSPDIVREIDLRRIRYAGRVESTREMRTTNIILVQRIESMGAQA
jgi:hypothetical protein